MARIQLDIVTPEAAVLKEEVDEVVAPGAEGQFDVLPGHTTLLAELEKGSVSYLKGGQTRSIIVTGGFAEVCEDHVTILADGVVKEV